MGIRLLLTLIIFTSFKPSQGLAISCKSILTVNTPEALVYENLNQVSFTKVEVFNQNNDIGIQQLGTLTFQIWYELSFEYDYSGDQVSIIGLNNKGHVYHLVKRSSNERTIARRLSGEKTFERLEVTNKGRILGLRTNGKFEVFNPVVWSEPAKKKALKSFKRLWAIGAGTGVIGAQFFPNLPLPVDMYFFSFNFPLFEFILSGAAGLSSGFSSLSKFERLNTYPNGFEKTNLSFNESNWYESLEGSYTNLEHFDLPNFQSLPPKLEDDFTQDIY